MNMMLTSYDNLHYVFACLATHSRIVKKIIAHFYKIHDYFNLSLSDESLLNEFFHQQGQKILSASVLMEEKRWREVLLTIQYVPKLIQEENLKNHWENYLDTLKIVHTIPETPLAESIQFLNYLLEQYKNNNLISQIIKYELTRNRTATYKFLINENIKKYNVHSIQADFDLYRAELNPSLLKESFDYSALDYLATFQQVTSINKSEKITSHLNENVIFLKSRISGLVRTIKLKFDGELWLTKMIKSSCLLSWIEEASNKMNINREICIHFINNLISNDVISIVSKNKD